MQEQENTRMNRLNATESFSPDEWNDAGGMETDVFSGAEEIRNAQHMQDKPQTAGSSLLARRSRFRVGITALAAVSLALAVTVAAVVMNARNGQSSLRRRGLLPDGGQTDMVMGSEDVLATGILYDMTSVYSGASSDTEIVSHLSGGSTLLIYDVYGQYYKVSSSDQTVKGFVPVYAVDTQGVEIEPRNGYKPSTTETVPRNLPGGITRTTQNQTQTTKKGKTVALRSLSFGFEEITLEIGQSMTANAIYTPADATETECLWVAGDDSVISVFSTNQGKSCKVTALKVGTARVTAISQDRKFAGGFNVTVKTATVKGLSFDYSGKDVTAGSSFKVALRTDPSDAAATDIVWRTGNTDAARFGSFDNTAASVAGVKEVTICVPKNCDSTSCVISAATKDGKFSAKFTLNVTAAVSSDPVSSEPVDPAEPTDPTDPTDPDSSTQETTPSEPDVTPEP
ncbi:MAG: Ig-like domain-containing protein [Clostridia bacterium]|nr:Ig-like domain-containing protein [Clostridia bacterium]MBQ1555771.1 Ig-like domain-containing protein [Clostridia bacterium]